MPRQSVRAILIACNCHAVILSVSAREISTVTAKRLACVSTLVSIHLEHFLILKIKRRDPRSSKFDELVVADFSFYHSKIGVFDLL